MKCTIPKVSLFKLDPFNGRLCPCTNKIRKKKKFFLGTEENMFLSTATGVKSLSSNLS